MQGYNMAMDAIKSGASQGLQALQGAGAESLIGGVGNLTQGVKAGALDVGAQAAEAQYQLKRDQASVQEEMNKRKEARLGDLYSSELEGAQIAAGAAQANKNAAVGGMFESIGSGVAAGLGALPAFAPEGKDWDKWFGNKIDTPPPTT
jgi:hypothetical protein